MGGRGDPPDWQKQLPNPYIPNKGQIMHTTLLLPLPPDFQTFLWPYPIKVKSRAGPKHLQLSVHT